MKFGSFASLRDALVGREVPCRIRGCDRHWLWEKEELAAAMAQGETQPPKRMCDSCHAHFESAQDQTIPCSRAGCTGTWTWPRMGQLEGWVRAGRPAAGAPAPRGLCATCRQAVQEKQDKEVPCRLRGCDGTWVWPAKAQLMAASETDELDPQPPKRLCPRCEGELKSLSDAHVPCRVRGCTGNWLWTRWSQLEAIRAGKSTEPPHRMCETCASRVGEFKDVEVPCRVRGCKNTWTFTGRAQLESQLAGETGHPKRMCNGCLDKFSHLEDQEVRCKRPGCEKKWLWKRGAQLAGKRKRPPPRFCDTCEAELEKLTDIAVRCENDGCANTWSWTRAAQLISGAKKPPHHMCEECAKFLEAVQPKDIPCHACGKAIHWSKHNQLMTKLGKWVEPTVCGSCKVHPPAPA